MENQEAVKPVHSIILDAGPLIKGEPAISTLLQQCEQVLTIPSVVAEIRDPQTRSRFETTVLPFLKLQVPKEASVQFVTKFASKTGDLPVLSKTDIQLIALAYDVECERNGGDWRLRNAPGQKRTNGPPPAKPKVDGTAATDQTGQSQEEATTLAPTETKEEESGPSLENLSDQLENATIETSEDSDSEGWITPSNIKRKQVEDEKIKGTDAGPGHIQSAIVTTDFAMQNVILQINLNLISPSLQRVKHVKTFILRCHACFLQVRDLDKQFCPRCGGATLTRVTCSTNQNGEFKIHLKKNMQWNNRGNKYSVPKPVHGSANRRVQGGGKGGWGNDLILSEDQKEFVRALAQNKRQKDKDLMDPDNLPSFLTGDRRTGSGKPKVGAGKDVNSRRR